MVSCVSVRSLLFSGESVYKDKLRNLDLMSEPGKLSAATGTLGAATSRSMPSICLDLEHLSMPHWLSSAEDNPNSNPHCESALDDADQCSQVSVLKDQRRSL